MISIKTIHYYNKCLKLLYEKLLNKNLLSEIIDSKLQYCNVNHYIKVMVINYLKEEIMNFYSMFFTISIKFFSF